MGFAHVHTGLAISLPFWWKLHMLDFKKSISWTDLNQSSCISTDQQQWPDISSLALQLLDIRFLNQFQALMCVWVCVYFFLGRGWGGGGDLKLRIWLLQFRDIKSKLLWLIWEMRKTSFLSLFLHQSSYTLSKNK